MKECTFLALAAFFSIPLHAQLTDSFTDGDLTSDPAWMGHTERFVVENETLRLKDSVPASNNAAWLYLHAPTSHQEETVWEWYVRLDFDPSPSNYARLYLQASLPDLTDPVQTGYFVKVGGATGAVDALELYRQDGASHTLLIAGAEGSVASQPAQASIRVLRSAGGEWSLLADYSGGTDFQPEGTAVDSTYSQGNYLGLVCYYTSTRSDDFYFDDVLVDPLYVDMSPPALLLAEAPDSVTVRVVFNEPLDEASALDADHYHIYPSIGQPVEAIWDPDRPEEALLSLSPSLQNGVEYVLTVTSLLDQQGNESPAQSVSFAFLQGLPGGPNDLLIAEIMADPSPPVALPEAEYLELYNHSGHILQLEGWTLSDGGVPAVFPRYFLHPGQLLIVCQPADTSLLRAYGAVLGLEGFPGLNNGGDRLSLTNAEGILIHQVAYTSGWYGESDKDDGGWSLEMINPMAPCEGASNWRASEHLLGGTPGQVNSVWTPSPDLEGPVPVSVFPESPVGGVVVFSEALGTAGIVPGAFLISGVEVTAAQPSEEDAREVMLEWYPPLEPGVRYELAFGQELTDCVGNQVLPLTLVFGLPEAPQPGDVVINEILFQPESGGAEFVELFNRSGKVVNMGDLIIGNIRGAVDSIAPVETDRLLLPGEYLVLCERPSDLINRYPAAQPERILANDLPVLPDPGGNVTLYAEASPGEVAILDAVDFDPEWHHPFLTQTRGVSLERIDPFGESNTASNWHSAAGTQGYATPTMKNSHYFQALPGQDVFSLPYKVFSPDGDGDADFLMLQYAPGQPGFSASVRIFDAFGRLVKVIAQNQLIGMSGSFRWDGDGLGGGKARMGIYIAWIRLVHPDGRVEEERHSFVLAGKL